MHLHIRAIIFISLLISLFASCKKFVDTSPNDRLSSEIIFADSATAASAITGIYTGNFFGNTDLFWGGLSIYPALSGDELVPSGRGELPYFYTNSLNPNIQAVYTDLWRCGYKDLYTANACIEGIEKSNNLSQSAKDKFIGEAKLDRAYLFFSLTNLFGDVPMVVSTDHRVNAKMPRTPREKIYEQIVADLLEAKDKLPEGLVSNKRFKPNRYAALALLSRVYLYLQQWNNAEKIATEILNNRNYDLQTDLNQVFKAGSMEIIWQLRPIYEGTETPEGEKLIPGTNNVIPRLFLSKYLLMDFEPGDERKTKWTAKNTVNIAGKDSAFFYPFKYQRKGSAGEPAEATCIFRLAEQYLIRAEARAQQNNQSGGEADLNTIRNRAGLDDIIVNGKDQLLHAIAAERRIELFCEGGHRWFDMKRSGTANSIMSVVTPEKGGKWSTNWLLYPISDNEIQVNPFLEQNKGY